MMADRCIGSELIVPPDDDDGEIPPPQFGTFGIPSVGSSQSCLRADRGESSTASPAHPATAYLEGYTPQVPSAVAAHGRTFQGPGDGAAQVVDLTEDEGDLYAQYGTPGTHHFACTQPPSSLQDLDVPSNAAASADPGADRYNVDLPPTRGFGSSTLRSNSTSRADRHDLDLPSTQRIFSRQLPRLPPPLPSLPPVPPLLQDAFPSDTTTSAQPTIIRVGGHVFQVDARIASQIVGAVSAAVSGGPSLHDAPSTVSQEAPPLQTSAPVTSPASQVTGLDSQPPLPCPEAEEAHPPPASPTPPTPAATSALTPPAPPSAPLPQGGASPSILASPDPLLPVAPSASLLPPLPSSPIPTTPPLPNINQGNEQVPPTSEELGTLVGSVVATVLGVGQVADPSPERQQKDEEELDLSPGPIVDDEDEGEINSTPDPGNKAGPPSHSPSPSTPIRKLSFEWCTPNQLEFKKSPSSSSGVISFSENSTGNELGRLGYTKIDRKVLRYFVNRSWEDGPQKGEFIDELRGTMMKTNPKFDYHSGDLLPEYGPELEIEELPSGVNFQIQKELGDVHIDEFGSCLP